MNIAFYIDEMNFRGVANSTYEYALNNIKILKNSSRIFYNKNNFRNKKEVIKKFMRFSGTLNSLFDKSSWYKPKINQD